MVFQYSMRRFAFINSYKVHLRSQRPMWPFRFAMHRKRGLRNMVIYLLSASPKNGVELMDGVESITRGWWRPTPGSIYPLLKDMTDHGVILKRDDGRYELSPQAKNNVEGSFGPPRRRPESVDEMVDQMHSFVSYMEDVRGTSGLGPHSDKLRGLAKRISDLIGDDDEGKSK